MNDTHTLATASTATRAMKRRPPEAPAPAGTRRIQLTTRQFDVLALMCTGMSNKTIAAQLGISIATVKIHTGVLLRALGAENRTAAVIRAQEYGLVLTPAACGRDRW